MALENVGNNQSRLLSFTIVASPSADPAFSTHSRREISGLQASPGLNISLVGYSSFSEVARE